MGIIANSDCQKLPELFLKLLAQTVVTDGTNYGFNATLVTPTECDCEPVMNCDNSHLDPETIIRLAFTEDGCGNLAIKFMNCDGSITPVDEEPQ